MLVKFGQLIDLNLKLEGDNGSVFPVASLRDQDGVGIAVVPLQHSGDGLYQNDTFPMPNQREVTAEYRIYSDAAFTNEITCNYELDFDIFRLNETLEAVENLQTQVAILASGGSPGESLVGFVADGTDKLVGLIHDSGLLTGIIKDADVLRGYVGEVEVLRGKIYDESASLVGYVHC